MASIFPYSPSSEDSSTVPYVLTFNNIPQDSHLTGLTMKFQYVVWYYWPPGSTSADAISLSYTPIGSWRIPINIKQGNTPLLSTFMIVSKPDSLITTAEPQSTVIDSDVAGVRFDLDTISGSQPIKITFYPGSLTYYPNSAQLMVVK